MVPVKLFLCFLFISTCRILASQTHHQQLQYFLQLSGVQRKLYSPSNSRNGQILQTNLDDFREVFSALRIFQIWKFKRHEKAILELNRRLGKLQPKIPKTQKFPCDLKDARSSTTPTSIHRLRPGDIDIIAAMGDSLTAGSSILAANLLQTAAEFRGITFMGGGLKDWRTYLTLPNILKVFNPNLYGYAVDNTLARERRARFSVGEPNAFTQDMPFQARVLVRRIQTDPKVDMPNHWKLITLFIGANDICSDMCYYDKLEDFLANHRQNLYKTLEILKTNVPRLLVNVLPVPNIPEAFLAMRNVPLSCYVTLHIACNCIISKKWSSFKVKDISRAVKRVQQIDWEVSNLPEFQTDSFAVAYQPFTTNLTLVKPENNDIKLSYFAVDCFHLSQLGQAAGANMLWNNMLEPEGRKGKILQDPFVKFECLTKNRPYLATKKNSLKEIK